MLTILGIGTGEFSSLTMQGYELLSSSGMAIILQTDRIPLAQELTSRGISFCSLDACYEQAEDFEELQELALEYLQEQPNALLCILGDIYTNTLVRALLSRCEAQLIPGVGFGSEALSLCAAELGEGPALCCSAYDFAQAEYTGSGSLVITEVDSPYLAAEVALKLQRYLSGEAKVLVIQRGKKQWNPLQTLCLRPKWDYSCAIVVPEQPLNEREGYTFEDFCRIMDVLLGENGCPWDRAQTHESLRAHLLEECYEVMEAIDRQEPFMLADELGDLLMQIVIHAKIAQKHGTFDPLDVSSEIARKMIRRHPHIFGDAEEAPDWEEQKKQEKTLNSYAQALADIPNAMSALLRAEKICRKAIEFGFFSNDIQWAEVDLQEALAELRKVQDSADSAAVEKAAGELLLAVIKLLFLLGADGETALNCACERMVARCAEVERLADMQGKSLEELGKNMREMLWQKAKSAK